MKTVIHAWTQEFNIDSDHLKKYNYLNEQKFYFGLGDLIRSTIKLFYLSKKLKFKLIIDIQLHPISQYLKIEKHILSDYVLENKNNVNYVCYGALEDYINNNNKNILLILTNDFYKDEIIDEDCKSFIKNIFIPNEKYQKFIDSKIQTIPFQNYNIVHYRLNDNDFLNKKENMDFNMYLEHLKLYSESNDILISDTLQLKKYLFANSNIFTFDVKICHLGLSKDKECIRDTLFEFFLITKSVKIKTYCKIHLVSGFVKWISKIYDIPLYNFNY